MTLSFHPGKCGWVVYIGLTSMAPCPGPAMVMVTVGVPRSPISLIGIPSPRSKSLSVRASMMSMSIDLPLMMSMGSPSPLVIGSISSILPLIRDRSTVAVRRSLGCLYVSSISERAECLLTLAGWTRTRLSLPLSSLSTTSKPIRLPLFIEEGLRNSSLCPVLSVAVDPETCSMW